MINSQVVIYHNPRCSKSRATLQILQEHGIQPKIIEYLKTPPNGEEINELLDMLNISPRNLLRKGEDVYKLLDLKNKNISDTNIVSAMVNNPILIERPIVVINGKAKIGRPPEQVLDLF
jgi:arsenate reductase